ncbi:hypothetical protein BpHYR1_051783 [Brachionus plicatilis]|uniref:Uncharacterized protein n=1 Tax=Brachionus plicatilis TaxID=10195 RepID=A0A3M7Q823_BRAPC|nr:hypothetical protein BpHYR1_051783 [Brachionus plicatilis]
MSQSIFFYFCYYIKIFSHLIFLSTFLNKVDSFFSTTQAALEHRLSTCSRVLKQLYSVAALEHVLKRCLNNLAQL